MRFELRPRFKKKKTILFIMKIPNINKRREYKTVLFDSTVAMEHLKHD